MKCPNCNVEMECDKHVELCLDDDNVIGILPIFLCTLCGLKIESSNKNA